MRQELITSSTFRRTTSRANLGVILLVGILFSLVRVVSGPPDYDLGQLALPFVLLLAHLALSPVPWQWTGDDRPMAGLGRGFLQALVFNLLWLGLLMTLLHLTGGGSGPRELRPPPDLPPLPDAGPGGPDLPFRHHHDGLRLPQLGLLFINTAFGVVFGWVFAQKEATEQRERSMAGLLRQSRSRALQNQLEPHVLYNALNGLSELVHEDPEAAEEMIARLADLYRTLAHYGDSDLVPLMKERLLVESYLAMEEMRLGDRLHVAWDWPGWADAVLMPPLFLQTLVENAIKHGISSSVAGGVLRIACARDEEANELSVANTGQPLPGKPRTGVGLENLKARLELWPEAAGSFTLAQEGEWTVARIRWTARTK
jgi:hypothetical protein